MLARSIPRVVGSVRTMMTATAPATLPPLGHAYNAFMPVISEQIMTIHHTKHHATYVTNLNVALEKAEIAAKKGDVNTLIALAPAVSLLYVERLIDLLILFIYLIPL